MSRFWRFRPTINNSWKTIFDCDIDVRTSPTIQKKLSNWLNCNRFVSWRCAISWFWNRTTGSWSNYRLFVRSYFWIKIFYVEILEKEGSAQFRTMVFIFSYKILFATVSRLFANKNNVTSMVTRVSFLIESSLVSISFLK